eukprot:jgi/Mesen1/246/ME1143323C07563
MQWPTTPEGHMREGHMCECRVPEGHLPWGHWVCTWGGRTTVSPVAALAIGGQPQLGLNFTHLLSSNKHKSKETTPSLHFKALYSTRTSAYSVSLHAKLGELLE